MAPNEIECEAGRVKMLLDELSGKAMDPAAYKNAFDYGISRHGLDVMTALLCRRLQEETDLASRSLEMQMWWRDHQQADERKAKPSKQSMTVADLIAELSKLPQDSLVILQKDAEGNGYSPLHGVDDALYAAETTWFGECYRPDDEDVPRKAVPCVVLHSIN